jgi:hypothetical protein
MVRCAPQGEDAAMTMKPNMTQREMVRLAVLVCGDRSGAKYSRPVKGVQNAANVDPTRGFDR